MWLKSFIVVIVSLFLSLVFARFALHNLADFETTDEKLWKETRIPQYWKGWEIGRETGNWEKININDKPGVTLALLSGFYLKSIPDPTGLDHSLRSHGEIAYTRFDTEDMEEVNSALRTPVVAAATVAVFAILLLVFIWSRSVVLTVAAGIFIALNPMLIGISQILNPDATFWFTALAALVGFLCMLRVKAVWTWPLSLLVGTSFGFALLSKYTANLLPLFFLLLLLATLLEKKSNTERRSILRRTLLQLILIFAIGYGLYGALFPIVLVDHNLFLLRTIYSEWLRPVLWPMLGVYGFLLLDAFFVRAYCTNHIMSFFRKYLHWILRVAAGALFLLFALCIANAWTDGSIVPLEHLHENFEYTNSSRSSVLDIPKITQGYNPLVGAARAIVIEASNFVFSMPLAVLLVSIIGCVWIMVTGKIRFAGFALFALVLPWIFVGGGYISMVFVNARYAIFMQPIFALFAALVVMEILAVINDRRKWKPFVSTFVLGGLIALAFFDIRSITPHYFNYENALLPKRFSLANSWSYGMYEAAQWINAQPNAKDMRVWSDRQAFCRYFVGKCIRSRAIDRSFIVPDYFVISTRNVVLPNKHFRWEHPEKAFRDSESYYSEESLAHPAWELVIGGRPSNYVKIIKSDEYQGYVPE